MHHDRSPSLSLADGDDGRLLVRCHAGCDGRDVLRAIRGLDLGDVDLSRRRDSLSWSHHKEVAAPVPGWNDRDAAIWSRAVHWRGTPVEHYVAGRLGKLPERADVRFLAPSAKHPNPTMLALVTDFATCKPQTLHFTPLHRGADGRWRRGDRRLLSGRVKKGGVVRLDADEDVEMGLGVAEGIETAACIIASGWRPVWATVDAGNMRSLPVVPGIECLTAFADNDKSGTGQSAAEELVARWRAAGREAVVMQPPDVGTDWADVATVNADREVRRDEHP